MVYYDVKIKYTLKKELKEQKLKLLILKLMQRKKKQVKSSEKNI